MKKLFPLLLTFFLVCLVTPVLAEDLEIDLRCPSDVNVGADLTVKGYFYNGGGEIVNLLKYTTGIVVNTGANNLGGMGVYGPFSKKLLSKKTIVPGGSIGPTNIPVMTVPGGIQDGSTALVYVLFLTWDGKEQCMGECWVKITGGQ